MRVFYKATMELFFLRKQELRAYRPAEEIDIVPVTKDNLSKLEIFGKRKVRKAVAHLRQGDRGLFAVSGDRLVGYGWIKYCGSNDAYYRIGEGAAYLSSFFVHGDYRGKGIYPALITRLIQSEDNCDAFYISAYTSNTRSLRGLQKVGFEHIRTVCFWRACMLTLNKRMLVKEVGLS